MDGSTLIAEKGRRVVVVCQHVIHARPTVRVVIPLNIIPDPFVQLVADNNDFNEETLDGKQTTHATMLVVYQRQPFGPKLPLKIHTDHTPRGSLEKPVQGQPKHEGRKENFELRGNSTTTQNVNELACTAVITFALAIFSKEEEIQKSSKTW
ncbi:unnamed protein product [Porites evermanni]|uniref:Uncharacterized protein n=1 Tax=Porites evermanni TaxID=104178 RepID=A0ABN8LEF8_9CNID|nr:unnamed protein product [Porites evermanni]